MTTAQTTTSTWSLDTVHSSAAFAVEYMSIALFKGRFHTVEGTIALDEQDPTRSSVNAAIDVKSIDAQGERFVGHLVSDTFFDVEKFPQITFRSTRVDKTDDTHWKIAGDLTLHGVTRPAMLDTEYLGQATHPFSKQLRAAFRATTSLNRSDFGLTWNAVLDTGAAYVGERVSITLDIVAGKQEG